MPRPAKHQGSKKEKNRGYKKEEYQRRKEYVAKLAESLGKTPFKCEKCGQKKHRTSRQSKGIQYHHRLGEKKLFNIAGPPTRPEKEYIIELKKCDCICYSCHREVHWLEAKGINRHNHGKGHYNVKMTFDTKKEAEEARHLLVEFKQAKRRHREEP